MNRKPVISYDPKTGGIRSWRYEPEGYNLADHEFVPESEPDYGRIERSIVDVDAEPPALVEDPDYDPRTPAERALDRVEGLVDEHPVRRRRVSMASKDAFRTARDQGDVQAQTGVLFEILTGEEP